MPALSWNEIRQNAIRFSREWSGETEERAEAQRAERGEHDTSRLW